MITSLLAVALIAHAHIGYSDDDARWYCVTDGNRICGPDNANGVQAGCYSDAGTLVAPWPCHIVVNPDGSADVYTP